jgi:hypothetical protein
VAFWASFIFQPGGRPVLEWMNRELIEFIVEKTGISRDIVVRILRAEEAFFELEVERALKGNLSKDDNI